jgi:hypothetical protein
MAHGFGLGQRRGFAHVFSRSLGFGFGRRFVLGFPLGLGTCISLGLELNQVFVVVQNMVSR